MNNVVIIYGNVNIIKKKISMDHISENIIKYKNYIIIDLDILSRRK